MALIARICSQRREFAHGAVRQFDAPASCLERPTFRIRGDSRPVQRLLSFTRVNFSVVATGMFIPTLRLPERWIGTP